MEITVEGGQQVSRTKAESVIKNVLQVIGILHQKCWSKVQPKLFQNYKVQQTITNNTPKRWKKQNKK